MEPKKLMNFALKVGEVMLRSGAETYRVEDTMNRILQTSNYAEVESYVIPTGLFVSLIDPDIDDLTYIRRINDRQHHLNKIELANTVSREFCNGTLSLNEAIIKIKTIEKTPSHNTWIMFISTTLSTGLFALVFAGTFSDFVVASIAGLILVILQLLLAPFKLPKFFVDLSGGFVTALTCITFFHTIGLGSHLDLMITSSVMPLVPGVAITNAVRDTIHGDLVSGSARMLDAFIVAASIATGVGIALSIFRPIFGGLL